jgi:hypothetical protein
MIQSQIQASQTSSTVATSPRDGRHHSQDPLAKFLKQSPAAIDFVQTVCFDADDYDNGSFLDSLVDDDAAAINGPIIQNGEINDIINPTNFRFCQEDPGTAYTQKDVVKTELLSILLGSRSPLYLYDAILKWHVSSQMAGMTILEAVPQRRNTYLKDLFTRFEMEDQKPCVKAVTLHCGRSVDVVCFDFLVAIKSLLSNPRLMHPNNVSFDFSDPCKAPQPSDVRSELHTGSWWIDAHNCLCIQPNDFLVPLMFFIDRTHTVENSKFTMEPVLFSLGIFRTTVRNKVIAWRPLGLIPKLDGQSLALNKNMTADDKCKDYHTILAIILSGVQETQKSGGFKYNFNFHGKQHSLVVKVPVGLVLGDAEGLDNQCGRIKYYLKTFRLCRECDCSYDKLDKPSIKCSPVGQVGYAALLGMNDKTLMDAVSQRFITPCWYALDFGGDPLGINGHCPPEKLHSIHEGMMRYLILLFSVKFGTVTSAQGLKNRTAFDTLFIKVSKMMQHQSDRDMPRCNFHGGFHGCFPKITGNETVGVMLVACLVMATDAGIKLCKDKVGMSMQEIKDIQIIFEGMVCYNSWFSQESYDVHRLMEIDCQSIVKYYTKLVKIFPRETTEQGWKMTKFHQQMHTVRNIERFGSPQVFNGGPMEKNLKFLCKLPAKTSQKRHHLMDLQSGQRIIENIAIGVACREFLGKDPFEHDDTDSLADDGSTNETPSTGTDSISTSTGGARFILKLQENNGGFAIASVTSNSATIKTSGVDLDLIRFLGKEVLPFITKKSIEVLCEHKRDGNTFHAHPNYLGQGSWYDWADFKWIDEESGIPYIVLGKIFGFVLLGPEFDFTDPRLCASLRNETTGIFAIVNSCKDPSESLFNSRRSKMFEIAHLMGYESGKRKQLMFVTVDCISAPAVVVPNIGGIPGSVLQVKPQHTWQSFFSF